MFRVVRCLVLYMSWSSDDVSKQWTLEPLLTSHEILKIVSFLSKLGALHELLKCSRCASPKHHAITLWGRQPVYPPRRCFLVALCSGGNLFAHRNTGRLRNLCLQGAACLATNSTLREKKKIKNLAEVLTARSFSPRIYYIFHPLLKVNKFSASLSSKSN